MLKALSEGKWDLVSSGAHSLKSSAANVGASKLRETFKAIELNPADPETREKILASRKDFSDFIDEKNKYLESDA